MKKYLLKEVNPLNKSTYLEGLVSAVSIEEYPKKSKKDRGINGERNKTYKGDFKKKKRINI